MPQVVSVPAATERKDGLRLCAYPLCEKYRVARLGSRRPPRTSRPLSTTSGPGATASPGDLPRSPNGVQFAAHGRRFALPCWRGTRPSRPVCTRNVRPFSCTQPPASILTEPKRH